MAADLHPDLRLSDLTRHDRIAVTCPRCGRVVHFPPAKLLRQHQLRHATRIIDLKLRCMACGTREGFRIVVFDERGAAPPFDHANERIVVDAVIRGGPHKPLT